MKDKTDNTIWTVVLVPREDGVSAVSFTDFDSAADYALLEIMQRQENWDRDDQLTAAEVRGRLERDMFFQEPCGQCTKYYIEESRLVKGGKGAPPYSGCSKRNKYVICRWWRDDAEAEQYWSFPTKDDAWAHVVDRVSRRADMFWRVSATYGRRDTVVDWERIKEDLFRKGRARVAYCQNAAWYETWEFFKRKD